MALKCYHMCEAVLSCLKRWISSLPLIRSCPNLKTLCFFLIVVFGFTGTILLFNKKTDKPRLSIHQVGDPTRDNPDFLRRTADELLDIGIEIKHTDGEVHPSVFRRLNKVVNTLYPPAALSEEELNSGFTVSGSMKRNKTYEVCNEVYLGTRHGYPYFQDGFQLENCTYNKPINTLVTVLVNMVGWTEDHIKRVPTIVSGIREYHAELPIVFAVDNKYTLQEDKNIRVLKFENSTTHGVILNSLVREVQTPYLLFAKDITHFTSYVRLERQILVISDIVHVGVVGGSFRNLTGHWQAGCYQTKIKNFYLKYLDGYYYSTEECMFCDYIEGSILVRPSLIKQLPFDEQLPEEVVFHDWSLRLKENKVMSVMCPDIMYFTAGIHQKKAHARDSWMQLARNWKASRISLPPNTYLEYSCKEANLVCDPALWQYKIMPICCLQEQARILKQLLVFTEKHDIKYELGSETVLGAVKFGRPTPWTNNLELTFFIKDLDIYNRLTSELSRQVPFPLTFKPLNDSNNFLIITETQARVLVHLRNVTSESVFGGGVVTKIKLLGMWVVGPSNPGLYCLERYGTNYLQHVYFTNNKSIADRYLSCTNPNHACLSRYGDSGNLQFSLEDFRYL